MVDIRNNKMNDTAYDEQALAMAVKKLQGIRTLPQMAEDTGLSVSLLGKMSACKLPSKPSLRSLKKLSDPNSRPQANVTYKHLLDICGYEEADGAQDKIVPVGSDARYPHKASFEVATSLYFDDQPITQGMSMLTADLIKKGFGPQLNIRMGPSFFEIEDESAGLRATGITGFCRDKSGISTVKLVLKAKIFDALCDEPDPVRNAKRTFYILVDDMELFHYCITKLPNFQCRDLVVLYTEDYRTFIERWSRTEAAAQGADSGL